jgi:hypothetical protein
MHITTTLLIVSILGLVLSPLLVGGLICVVTLVMGLRLFLEEKSIPTVRIVAISVVGIIVPFIMYFNTFGFGLPAKDGSGKNAYVRIVESNLANFGINLGKRADGLGFGFGSSAGKGESGDDVQQGPHGTAMDGLSQDETAGSAGADASGGSAASDDGAGSGSEDDMVYVTNDKAKSEESAKSDDSGKKSDETQGGIFESLDSIAEADKNKGGIVSIAPSDDDMPSYGGLPVGTLLIAQYFREDDHNCNPVLVLQNKTGELVRYECRFIARSAEGDELSVSEKTVEVVRDGALFVFEGRFDKRDLGGKIPDAYEFSITKRNPYEEDMASEVAIYTATEGASALLTAENKSDKKVKVDAYVLFFDGNELVDCMWMIPQNTDEVCLEPGTAATIKGDAYYRFDRVETFYTAYEALGD